MKHYSASLSVPRSFWYSATIVALFTSAFAAWVIVRPGDHTTFVVVDDIGQALGWLLAAILCLVGIDLHFGQSRPSADANYLRTHRWIPLLFSVGCFCEFIGQCIYTYNDMHHLADFPSWADAGYLSALPFLLLGIALLPTHRVSSIAPTRLILDSLLLIVAVITFSWYFVLGPTFLQGNETILAKVVGTTYPAFDLIFICCVLMMTSRAIDRALRPAIILLSLALIVIVLTDSLYDFQTLQGTYTNGWQDLGWPLGYLLLALAGQALKWPRPIAAHEAARDEVYRKRSSSIWRMLLPYGLIPALVGLAAYVWNLHTSGILAEGTYAGVAILLMLIFIRQVVAVRETDSMNKELKHANALLEALATTDPLTELPNHRALVSALDQELQRSQRYARSCSVVFLDIDHFKALNDGYGHPAGDTVLREFAATVRNSIRSIDTVGRWGGEEFVVILPETSATEAMYVAEKIRMIIAHHSFNVGGGMHLTSSAGVASFPLHAETRDALLEAADSAMYGSKRLGRNQVRIADDPAVLAILASKTSEGGRDEAALQGTILALAKLVDIRDAATGHHSQHVGQLVQQLALTLGLSSSEAQMITLAGQLHDIGKIALPDSLLLKNGQLTEEQMALMKTHSAIGADVVSFVPALRPIAPLIRAHHEWWNGQGYPYGLSGTAIPLGARIIAVADAFSAMTMERPYQQPRSEEVALAELQACAGQQFDPVVVEAFVQLMRSVQRQEARLQEVPLKEVA